MSKLLDVLFPSRILARTHAQIDSLRAVRERVIASVTGENEVSRRYLSAKR